MKTKNNQIYDFILRFKYLREPIIWKLYFCPTYFYLQTSLCKRNALNQHTGMLQRLATDAYSFHIVKVLICVAALKKKKNYSNCSVAVTLGTKKI